VTAVLPVIELRGAGLTYPGPPPVTALRPADLTIGQGELVTVIGPSGSGKSTFLNLVGLLDRPTAGTYLLDGIDTAGLREADRTALRGRQIGFVFQAFHLLPARSAVDNVTLSLLYSGPSRRDRRRIALELLDLVGLGSRAYASAAHLSGGERQRVAIARALAGRPSLLLCDEPTGNLDSANADQILELITSLHRDGYTVLIVTHNQGVAAHAPRIVTIMDGVLTADAL
jgi:putative ABC transport system ATP-binding protein